jgi:Mn2+/Fe2+ NRAMP family transporter
MGKSDWHIPTEALRGSPVRRPRNAPSSRLISMAKPRGLGQALGPGLLFAAASVGVSHLVQSTRAGADYGLSLIALVVFANAIKYPAFRFAPQYSAATGTSILEGYRRQGRWALALYGVLTLLTMFTVQAVVTVVTAGLFIAALEVDPIALGSASRTAVGVSALLIAASALLLGFGKYRVLDRVTKALVVVLAVSTLVSAGLVVPKVDFAGPWLPSREALQDRTTIFFIVALVGWMPSAIDVSVWQSLWTLARKHDSGHAPTVREATMDFHIGYFGTVVFALCFVLMGAGVMHGRGIAFADSAGAFAGQVIELYTATLGGWSRPLIAASAFAVMFSTTLTVVDGFPRALSVLSARVRGPETGEGFEMDQTAIRRIYWLALALLAAGSITVLATLLTSLKALVDVATTLSFLTAPILSLLSHRAITGPEVALADRPRPWLRRMSLAGIAFQGVFALFYLWLRFL